MELPTYYHKEFELYSGTNEMPHLRDTHLVNSDGLQGASEEAKAAVKERKEGGSTIPDGQYQREQNAC